MVRMLIFFLLTMYCGAAFAAEEKFVVLDGVKGDILAAQGPNIDERVTPASTFKIALSLIGYDAGILLDEDSPVWDYQEGYDDYLESWKQPQSPKSWMARSCIWYSKLLAIELGRETIEDYLAAFEYGNGDMSGGLTKAWVDSSLKVSPFEQVTFIQKVILGELPISNHASLMTKTILFREVLSGGWALYGKTGFSPVDDQQIGWFVGWIEKDHEFFPFAYQIRDVEINLDQRIPRAKELLLEYRILP